MDPLPSVAISGAAARPAAGAGPAWKSPTPLSSLDRKLPVPPGYEAPAKAAFDPAKLENAFKLAIDNRKKMALDRAVAATEAALREGKPRPDALQAGFEVLHANLPKQLGPYNRDKAREAWTGWRQKKEAEPREAMQWAVSSWEEFARIRPNEFVGNIEQALKTVKHRTLAQVCDFAGFTSLMEDVESGLPQAIASFAQSVECPLLGSQMVPGKPRGAKNDSSLEALVTDQAARDEALRQDPRKPQVMKKPPPPPAAVTQRQAAVEEAFGRAIADHEETALAAANEAAKQARDLGRADFAEFGFDILNGNLLSPLQGEHLKSAREAWRAWKVKLNSSTPEALMKCALDALRMHSPVPPEAFAMQIHDRIEGRRADRLDQLAMGSGFYSLVMDPKTGLPQTIADLALAMKVRLKDCSEYLPKEGKEDKGAAAADGRGKKQRFAPSLWPGESKSASARLASAPAAVNLDDLVRALRAVKGGADKALVDVLSQPESKKLAVVLGPILQTASKRGKPLDEEQRDDLQARVIGAALGAGATEKRASSLAPLGPRVADALIAGDWEELKRSLAEMLKLLTPG